MTHNISKQLPQQIINQARTWLGTSFKHQGRLKKSYLNRGGVDCLGLLMGVAKELNLSSGLINPINHKEIKIIELDDLEYTSNSSPVKLINGFNKICNTIDNLEQAQIGDLILFNFEGQPKHLAFLSNIKINNDYKINIKRIYYIIHSYIQANGVVEHLLDDEWKNKIYRIYRLKLMDNY